MPLVGLEPRCSLGFRDEFPALVKTDDARRLAENALLFEEFLAREAEQGALALEPVAKRALLHGHCHQKSCGAMAAVEREWCLLRARAVFALSPRGRGQLGGSAQKKG
jgi:hypothetical protein